jgi:serine/threonine-protein kinase
MTEWDTAAAGLASGSRITGYLLEQQVGRGATGVVFQARDEKRGRPVALKIIGPPLATDQAFSGRLRQQAQAAAAIGEPHILPALQVGEADGKLFVAMPFIHGADVRSLVRREGALPPQRVAPIVWRVASALDAAHAAGLVHGDVKPGNVLVESRPGQPDLVYLSDFGQGRAPASSPALAGTARVSEALDGIAPEQAQGQQADGRADQYALACVAFELLTGVPPFRHDQPAALASGTEPPRAASLRPGLPPEVDNVLGRALAQVVAYRYQSCQDFANALHGAFWPDPSPGQPSAGQPAEVPVAEDAPAVPVPAGGGPDVPVPAGGVPAGPFPGATLAGGWGPGGAGPGGPYLSSTGSPVPGGAVSHTAVPEATVAGTSPSGAEAWLVHGRRRRFPLGPFLFVVAAVVIVGGLVAGLIVGLGGGSPATPKPTALRIAAKSASKPETGDVWTVYGVAGLSGAQIYGDIKGAVSGEVARLYDQQFPFNSAPVPAGSPVRLHPRGKAGTATYSFTATPTLATRYQVKVFQSSSAKTALARTAITIVYVASGFSPTASPAPCKRPVCHEVITGHVLVPASAMSTEISKPTLAYFALNLAKSGTPPQPATLQLGGGAAVVRTKLVSATEYQIAIGFTFTIGKTDGYNWGWNACTKDTEAEDGIGLPGSHGCGDKTIPNQANYIG